MENLKLSIPCAIIIILLYLFTGLPSVFASEPVAKISEFSGEVILQSGDKVSWVHEPGQILKAGDRIQTRQGVIRIVFNDGALLTMRPFTNVMIQEREEKRRTWLFKTVTSVRRISCFVGKLRFKSGLSKRKNYLQTPTAVCGLRGSESDLGFDTLNTYLNMYSGEADVTGRVVRGLFDDFTIDIAVKSRVYNSLEEATGESEKAGITGRKVDMAKARVKANQVAKVASIELKKNPDETVQQEAEILGRVADAAIAASESLVIVEQITEAKEAAEKTADEARLSGDVEAAEKAAEDIESLEDALIEAAGAADVAVMAADIAAQAGEDLDFEGVETAAEQALEAADEAKDVSEESTELIKEIIPESEISPEIIQPEEPVTEEKETEEATAEVITEESVASELVTSTSEQEIYKESVMSPSQ